MSSDPQGRMWNITINNPAEVGLNKNKILEIMDNINTDYYCYSEEIGAAGTHHCHVFMFRKSAIRFSTIQKRFPTAHIERVKGSAKENRDYIAKEGKWADTAKAETKVEGTFCEFGELPTKLEAGGGVSEILEAIKEGKDTLTIIEEHPDKMFYDKNIDELRERYMSQKFLKENRKVEVVVLFGDTGTGKTKYIYENHSAVDICRVTDYGKNGNVKFDAYHSQKVLVFEEFHCDIKINNMLNYLDIYPLMLPARYNDRVACYEKVYITTNMNPDDFYLEATEATRDAFFRRVDKVIYFGKELIEPEEVTNLYKKRGEA